MGRGGEAPVLLFQPLQQGEGLGRAGSGSVVDEQAALLVVDEEVGDAADVERLGEIRGICVRKTTTLMLHLRDPRNLREKNNDADE